jgi:hypothetical protein
MGLAVGVLMVLALIFGPSLWVKLVMRRYSSEMPEMPGTGGELAKHFDRAIFFKGCGSRSN